MPMKNILHALPFSSKLIPECFTSAACKWHVGLAALYSGLSLFPLRLERTEVGLAVE